MSNDLRTSIVIDLTGNLERRAVRYGRSLERMSQRGERHLNRMSRAAATTGRVLDRMGNRYTAMIAGAGAGLLAKRALGQSADLDKQLIRLAQTAGRNIRLTRDLRKTFFEMAKDSGNSMEDLLSGYNSLIQAGQTWEEALATIAAINPAMAVTSASAQVLASGLTVAAEAFDFDLSKPETAVDLLDKMTVAGRLGKAELEDLSGIFARVGGNAKEANLSFDETLGLIEQLSQVQVDPARLATLVDSTLRLFTNNKYLEKAQEVTGVSFFDADKNRRAAFDVLQDIARKYQSLGNDVDRNKALSDAFGAVDLDTMKGLRTLLGGDALFQVRQMTDQIKDAGGAIARDLPDALNNSIDQANRLKITLREAADDFAQPVNDAVKDAIKHLLNPKSQGGMGLDGKDLLIGGALGAAGLFASVKGGGKLLSRLGGTATGVVMGKALEQAANVTPVYVVNMPAGGMGIPGLGGSGATAARHMPRTVAGWKASLGLLGGTSLSRLPMLGAGAMGTAAGGVGLAGAVGYGGGTLLSNLLDDKIRQYTGAPNLGARLYHMWNDDGAKRRDEFQGKVTVEVDDKRARVSGVESNHPDFEVEAEEGREAVTAW